MCIGSVYRDHAIFRYATELAIKHSRADIDSLQLPIPAADIGKPRPGGHVLGARNKLRLTNDV